MLLFVAFVAVPLIEIALFIQVGGAIGLWPTLGIVVLTALMGTILVRREGTRAIGNLRQSFSELRDPSEPLVHGAMILFSGALLLTPGFFTDAVGFLLLIPGVRALVFQYIKNRVKVAQFDMGGSSRDARAPHGRNASGVIDGDFEDVTPSKKSPPGQSGWTRH